MSQSPPVIQDKIWSYYQTEKPEIFFGIEPRLNYILKRIDKKRTSAKPKVLNIGVGNGYLERKVSEHGWQAYSLDPDERSILELNKSGILGRVGGIESMPFADEEFDFVVTSEVLEHLTKQQTVDGVREVARVLRNGGWYMGTVPYKEDLSKDVVVCPKCSEVFHRWGHLQAFDEARISNLLPGNLVAKLTAPKLFLPFGLLNWKGKIAAVLKSALFSIGVHGSDERLYFEARKVIRQK